MKTVFEHLRNYIYDKCGIVIVRTTKSLEELRRTQWSDEFEELQRSCMCDCLVHYPGGANWHKEFEILQRNRMVMGALRYGDLGAAGKTQWNRIPDIIRRINAYQNSGNTEHLVDSANLCLLAYIEDDHPKKHWEKLDDFPSDIITCLKHYQKTGNTQFLVIAANFSMLIFITDKHPNKHWASIDDGIHTRAM